METFLTIREVARELNVSEDNVLSLVKKERVSAYRIGGEYIRLRREDVLQLKDAFWTEPLPKEKKGRGLWQWVKNSSIFFLLTAVCLGLGYYILQYLL